MASDLLSDAAKLVAAADLMRKAADAMHDRRTRALDAGELDVRQFRKNVVDEGALRSQVGEILLAARRKAVDGADGAQADLEGRPSARPRRRSAISTTFSGR